MTADRGQQHRAGIEAITRRMKAIGSPEPAIECFIRQYRKLAEGARGMLDRSMIQPLTDVPEMRALARYGAAGEKALQRTLMIKLNGGLGTSMGLNGPKSLLPVKNGLTFLDILIGQVMHIRNHTGCPMPLVLMDSFNTQEITRSKLATHPDLLSAQKDIPSSFLQHRVPKIREDDLMPVEWPKDPAREWCPPGHGDLYLALLTSNTLPRLLEAGFEYAFVSNADNLGATMDLAILGFFAEEKLPFLMEVTERTEADRKGGHIATTRDGTLVLRELAQCPEDEVAVFQDIGTFRFFNTNNLWVNLKALDAKLRESGGGLDLPLIVNRKTVDAGDPQSTPVFQLETAMGAAISVFKGARAVLVPRSRFAPVKTTNDLLGLWSDAYTLTEDMRVTMAPEREGQPVVIHLDRHFYSGVDDLTRRFPNGAPSLQHCDSFTVEGDVTFGRNVVARGTVRVDAPEGQQRFVPDGAEL